MNGLSCPIIGDGTHGNTKVNRMWRERGFKAERFGLHLLRMKLPETENVPGINVVADVPEDLKEMWKVHVPGAIEIIEEMYKGQSEERVSGDVIS